MSVLKLLAKLRQFDGSQTIEEYAQGELRQNWRAIESAFRRIETLVQDAQEAAENIEQVESGLASFYASEIGTFNTSASAISATDRVSRLGSYSAGVWTPPEAGKYWVDFGMSMTPGIAGSVINSLWAKYASGTTACELRKTVTGGQGVQHVSGRCFMNLTTSNGAYFLFDGDANTIGFNFYCSLTKVS